METVIIYGFYDGDGRIRYLGKTNDLHNRMKAHLAQVRLGTRTPLYNWWRKIKKPDLKVIMETPKCLWEDVERGFISSLRLVGAKLLNLADGGEGASYGPQSPEHIEKRVAPLRKELPMITCKYCGRVFRQGIRRTKTTPQKFCNTSCSSKYYWSQEGSREKARVQRVGQKRPEISAQMKTAAKTRKRDWHGRFMRECDT